MTVIKYTALALAISAGATQLASAADFVGDQAQAKGFVEDASLNLLLRNYYWNRNKRAGAADDKDWTEGIQGVFSSGFTQGTIGVGIDAFGYLGLKLDGGAGSSGSGNLAYSDTLDKEGHVVPGKNHDSYGKAGAAIKFRVSRTQLEIGDQQPSTSPVFAVGGTHLTPETVSGISLMSSELKNLNLEAGHFYSGTSSDTTNRDGELWATYAGIATRAANYVGGKYAFNDNLSASLYGAKLENIWNQYYGALNYVLPLTANQSLTFNANGYHTTDTGSAKAGKIDNNAYSLSASYAFLSAHTVTLGFQKINGNTPFDYIGVGDRNITGDSIYLADSVQYSDFNGPGEKSFQARYDLNLATLGVPGLSFMARYTHGDDIDGTHMATDSAYRKYGYGADGEHHETDLEAKYVVQEGPAKNLSLRVREALHRGNSAQAEGNIDELRVMVDYPLSIL
ncbi:OprD family porin [Pseudomonas sp. RIT-To-2]|uniref:OprD family porin n=1 Tax=Pseudomonas sp. RIT-To-2 TaxID=3462541 RepID=UPI00241349ED